MAVPVCPNCHQPISTTRLGVRLPLLKAKIIDAIKAAGDLGISSNELVYEIYRGYPRPRTRNTIKAHVHQINEMLVETDWRIASERVPFREAFARDGVRTAEQQAPRWHLVRRRVRKAA